MRRALVLALIVAGALAPATAGAQVAIGPALNQPPATSEGCEAGVLPQLRTVVPLPPNCTMFAANLQVPRGSWRVTSVNIRTGPRTGPMRVQIVQALRSQAQAPGGPEASGAICCTSPAQSQVFTLPPNTISTVAVDIPVRNTVQLVENEPVEVVDYIGLSLLDLRSSLPAAADPTSSMTLFYPALNQGGQALMGPSLPGAMPLVSAVVCPASGANEVGSRRSMQAGGCPTVPVPGPAPVPGGPSPAPGPGGAAQAAVPAALRQVGVAGGPRRAAIPVACPASAGPCTGTVRATTVLKLPRGARNARRIATKPSSFRIAAGKAGTATLALPAIARRELARRGALAVNVVLTTSGAAASPRKRLVLRMLPRSVRANRAGAVRVLLDMPAQASASRRASVRLRRGRAVVASASVRSRPGRVVATTVRLTAAERARLARVGRARLVLRVAYRDGAGRLMARSRALTVVAPGR